LITQTGVFKKLLLFGWLKILPSVKFLIKSLVKSTTIEASAITYVVYSPVAMIWLFSFLYDKLYTTMNTSVVLSSKLEMIWCTYRGRFSSWAFFGLSWDSRTLYFPKNAQGIFIRSFGACSFLLRRGVKFLVLEELWIDRITFYLPKISLDRPVSIVSEEVCLRETDRHG
jgi:hypothetical protein